MEGLFLKVIYAILSLLLIFNYGMLVIGVTAKIVARVHGRIGPPFYQPYIDLVKSLSMRTAVTHGVMFWLGPVFRLTGGIGLYMLIPAVYGSVWLQNFSFSGDLILVIYFIFFGMLGMALGAGESGHPFSAMGVMRGLAHTTASEVPFALAIIAIAAQYHTLSITDIVAAQQGGISHWTLMTNPVATLAGILAYLGMMMHSPFDLHMAPQEIPIGPPTEYHSTYLAMMQSNRSIFASAKLILFMNLFFGGATSIPEMAIKTFLIFFFCVFVGVVFPRFRVEQSVRWFLKLPTMVGILAVVIYTVH